MAYSELVKNFNRIRDYMREFYVYGFKSRDEYTSKSARTYDDERRRLESWLGAYMQFRQTPEGKNVFISIDSRVSEHNPLFKAWKTKSFTDGDITLHFILFDILSDSDVSMSIGQITDKVDEYLSKFLKPRMFDESTIRKKLREYVSLGLLVSDKEGKNVIYRRAEDMILPEQEILDYFSEVLPCGVIGSYLSDKVNCHRSCFRFKHHYITSVMDSEITYSIFDAIREKRSITLEIINRNRNRLTERNVVPLKIMISVQNGRQYLMAYAPGFKRIASFRIDNIISAKCDDVCERFEELQSKFEHMRPHMWGVSTKSYYEDRMEYVEFTVRYADDEQYIRNRLEREKRCGIVEHLDSNTSRFTAEVFDASELIPWIRTFICRLVDIHFSNEKIEEQFKSDINEMYALYGIGGED